VRLGFCGSWYQPGGRAAPSFDFVFQARSSDCERPFARRTAIPPTMATSRTTRATATARDPPSPVVATMCGSVSTDRAKGDSSLRHTMSVPDDEREDCSSGAERGRRSALASRSVLAGSRLSVDGLCRTRQGPGSHLRHEGSTPSCAPGPWVARAEDLRSRSIHAPETLGRRAGRCPVARLIRVSNRGSTP
jgi:hypothetical protein